MGNRYFSGVAPGVAIPVEIFQFGDLPDALVDRMSDGSVRVTPGCLIYHAQSEVQVIDIFESKSFGITFLLDGVNQLSSSDEKSYHSTFAELFSLRADMDYDCRFLILGGGDGCLARELYEKHAHVFIDIVDYDPMVSQLFSTLPELQSFHCSTALRAETTRIFNQDAFEFLEQDDFGHYNCIFVDLTDEYMEAGELLPRIGHALSNSPGPCSIIIQAGAAGGYDSELLEEHLHKSGFGKHNINVKEIPIISFGEQWRFISIQY